MCNLNGSVLLFSMSKNSKEDGIRKRAKQKPSDSSTKDSTQGKKSHETKGRKPSSESSMNIFERFVYNILMYK